MYSIGEKNFFFRKKMSCICNIYLDNIRYLCTKKHLLMFN